MRARSRCIAFHPEAGDRTVSYRETKQDRVRTDRAHAALVLDDDGLAQGWAPFGDPGELSGIKHRRAYDKEPPPHPNWRITCIFVDRAHRGDGIARLALEGAIAQLAEHGGGLVEAISQVTDGRRAQGRFLFSATIEIYERSLLPPGPQDRQARVDRQPNAAAAGRRLGPLAASDSC